MTNGSTRTKPPRTSWRERRAAAAAAAAAAPPEELPPKLAPSVKELFSTIGGVVHTRLALAGLELEEEIQRLIGAAVYGVVAIVAVFMALVVGTFTIVFAVPPEYRVTTLVVITVVYLLIAIVMALRVRSVFKGRPPIFGATLAELEKDKETLMRMSRARHVAESENARAEAGARDAYTTVTPVAPGAPGAAAATSTGAH